MTGRPSWTLAPNEFLAADTAKPLPTTALHDAAPTIMALARDKLRKPSC